MAGHERGHQLVAQLLVGHRRAVLVAGAEQQREHVVAPAVALAASLVDLGEDELVDARDQLVEAAVAAEAPDDRLQLGQDRERALAELEQFGQRLAQVVQALALVEAEHGAQDDLERQPLQTGVQRQRGRVGQRSSSRSVSSLHQAGQALHLLAVEGRQHQLALGEVLALVEQDHRVGAEDRLEDPRALAGMDGLGRRGEDVLDVGRLGDEHEWPLEGQASCSTRLP